MSSSVELPLSSNDPFYTVPLDHSLLPSIIFLLFSIIGCLGIHEAFRRAKVLPWIYFTRWSLARSSVGSNSSPPTRTPPTSIFSPQKLSQELLDDNLLLKLFRALI